MAEIEFTEKEKEFLTMLFKIGELIIETENGYFNPYSSNCIDRHDFFTLAEKLRIEY